MSKHTDGATIMAHMIPFFPDEATSYGVVETLVEAGIKYLEIQFPFSDPTADGPVIEAACMKALAQGFTVDKGFAFVRSVSQLCTDAGIKIMVMTYASLVFNRGVARFVGEAKASGAEALIVPDLPPDTDEGLYRACRDAGIACVPVVVPSIRPARLELVLKNEPEYVYCALRAGITGSRTSLDPATLDFLGRLNRGSCKVLGGFGISDPAQVAALKDTVHAVVVGSAIVRASQAGPLDQLGVFVSTLVQA
jgi:tryptophan synthase alpha chain